MFRIERLEHRALFSTTALPDIKANLHDSFAVPGSSGGAPASVTIAYDLTVRDALAAEFAGADGALAGEFMTIVTASGPSLAFTGTFSDSKVLAAPGGTDADAQPFHFVVTITGAAVAQYAAGNVTLDLGSSATARWTLSNAEGAFTVRTQDVLTDRSVIVEYGFAPAAPAAKLHGQEHRAARLAQEILTRSAGYS